MNNMNTINMDMDNMDNMNYMNEINWTIDRNRDDNFNLNRTQLTAWNPYTGEETITHIRNNYFNRQNRENDRTDGTRTRYYETFNQIDNIIGIGENWTSSDYIPFNYVPNESNESNIRQRPEIDVSIQQMVFNDEERNCCICFETRENEEICKLNCDHVFCVNCLHTHLERNYSCPLCRTPIQSVRVQNNGAMETINRDHVN